MLRLGVTLASLSAARCDDMLLGWSETPSRLLACGRDESAQERLGSESSCEGGMAAVLAVDEREEPDVVDMAQVMVAQRKVLGLGACRRAPVGCGEFWEAGGGSIYTCWA